MNKRLFIPFILILGYLLGYSCSKETVTQIRESHDYMDSLNSFPDRSFGKGRFVKGESEDYSVGEFDLKNLIRFKELERANRKVLEIIPIEWEGVPCMYVLQYDRGFEVFSSDKRSPFPLVVSRDGTFPRERTDEDSFLGHLDMMAEQIWFLKEGMIGDPSDPETVELINSSLDFWRMVNADEEFLRQNGKRIGKRIPPDTSLFIPEGHWELIGVSTSEEVYDSIPHLTQTRWHQWNPYNDYCPIDRDSTHTHYRKCPAGCVAIAGAQMLYYLHFKEGKPTSSPTTGYCTGTVYEGDVNQHFDNDSSITWALMSAPSSTGYYEALLVGDVGDKLDMNYGYYKSGAYTSDLVEDVFEPYGWESTYVDHYDADIIVSSLLSGYPVVCAGRRLQLGEPGKVGHAFLVDGYKRSRTKTISTYDWVYDNLNYPGFYPYIPPRLSVSYGTPYITHYKMNWGQGEESPENDVWCSLDGIWQYHDNPPYSFNRQMVYDFSIIPE